MPLTATAIDNAKPGNEAASACTIPAGCIWKFRRPVAAGGASRTASAASDKLLSLGRAAGRIDSRLHASARDDARTLLADGIDPSAARKAEKREDAGRAANSFEAVAREWYAKQVAYLGARPTRPTCCAGWKPTCSRRSATTPDRRDDRPRAARGRAQDRGSRRARPGAPGAAGCRPGVPLRRRHGPLRARPVGRPARRADPAQAPNIKPP